MRPNLPELTLRGCVIATLITVLFTAANIYLGLKIGLTFASSIPAAVISMAILRFFKDANMLENNIVQTFTSAAGAIASIIFILPALVMIGLWHDFPYWQTSLLCILGGILGVMYSIPLRRSLVVESDLPYPEGVAAAEVLKAGSHPAVDQASGSSILASGTSSILWSSCIAFIYSLLQECKIFAGSFTSYFKISNFVSGFGGDLSLALIGAGYLIGINIGCAILFGMFISWGLTVPILSSLHSLAPQANLETIANHIWSTQARFIGVGTIGIAAIWTMFDLIPTVIRGIKSALAALDLHKQNKNLNNIPRTEQDIPINYVFILSLILCLPLMALFAYFIKIQGLQLASSTFWLLSIICTLFTVLFGFFIAAISGYMAGIIGSSNSPISSLAILAIIMAAFFISYLMGNYLKFDFHAYKNLAIGLAIFTTGNIVAVATIANDNLQDLKTGYLVDATPWKQQLALIFGVIVGSLVVPVILELLYQAYGFAGALPHPQMDPKAALSAPQAVLISSLAQGIVGQSMNWGMAIIGVLIGIILIIINKLVLERIGSSLSVLSVGLGIYLPFTITFTLVIGSIISFAIEKTLTKPQSTYTAEQITIARKRGVLAASGLIVGASLFGVLIALLIVVSKNQTPLALVGEHFSQFANYLGLLSFSLICYGYYRYIISCRK